MPLIKIVSTGGTIANTSGGLIGLDDVLKTIPQAAKFAEIEVDEEIRVRSAQMRLPQWLAIARAVKRAADDAREPDALDRPPLGNEVGEALPQII